MADYAAAAAKQFGVGSDCEVKFQKDKARADVKGDDKKKKKKGASSEE
jgi:hypothetical protein